MNWLSLKAFTATLCFCMILSSTSMVCRPYLRKSAACRCRWSQWGTHTWSCQSCWCTLHSHTLLGFPCTHQCLAHEEETRGQDENEANFPFHHINLRMGKSYRWPVQWWCRCSILVSRCHTGPQTHLSGGETWVFKSSFQFLFLSRHMCVWWNLTSAGHRTLFTRFIPRTADIVGAAAHLFGHVEGQLSIACPVVRVKVPVAVALPHVCVRLHEKEKVDCRNVSAWQSLPFRWLLQA